MEPSALVTVIPSSFIHPAPSLAGLTSRAIPVLRLLAATLASIPALAITPIYRAASSTSYPAVLKIGAATLIAWDRPLTSNAELLQALAKTSAYFDALSKLSPKPLRVATSPPDTVSRSPPSAAAKFIAGASAAAASVASSPARAKLRVAVAASFIPKVEAPAASFMALFKRSASSAVFPMVAFTSVMVLSTSAKLLTPCAPIATKGTVTAVDSVLPKPLTLFPISSNFFPTSAICWAPTEPKSCSAFLASLSRASVFPISACRALYCSLFLSTPSAFI